MHLRYGMPQASDFMGWTLLRDEDLI
jgi:hypothetical protein